MEVAVGEEFFADALLVTVAGDAAVGQDEGAAAVGFEQLNDEDQKEVGGLLAAEAGGEVGGDAVGDTGAEGRVGEDQVNLLARADGVVLGFEAVAGVEVGDFEAVEDEVGQAEDVGDRFVFPAGDGGLQGGFVVEGADVVFADVVDGGSEEAAGAGGGVEDAFAEAGRAHGGHELGDGARGVVFALGGGVAQPDEDGFVDGAKDVAVLGAVKIEAVELVDDLTHGHAGLHVVVHRVEDLADDAGAGRGVGGFEVFEGDKQAVGGVVDEADEFVAGDTLGVGGPGAPLEFFGDDGAVVAAEQFEFLVLFVEDFEEEQPAELFEALGIAGEAGVFVAHDVADGFDDGGDVGHFLGRRNYGG